MTAERGSLLKACIAMGLAAIVHAGAFAWALKTLERPGVASRESTAISLNLIETFVVEASAGPETPETATAKVEPDAKPRPVEHPKAAPDVREVNSDTEKIGRAHV